MSSIPHSDKNRAASAEDIAKEFEDFASIVAHDLCAPLRHVKQFTRLFIESLDGELDGDQKQYIHFLDHALDRLEGMQDILLSYSRISTRAEPPTAVDMGDVVRDCLREMEAGGMMNSADIEIGEMPVIRGDYKQMCLVVSCLMDNALKFHADDSSRRRVIFSSKAEGDHSLFEMADNGIGIDAAYHDEVFRLFRQLHPEQYGGGMGAGLTLCKKIIERHGGAISLRSAPGQGTRVLFTLPRA